MTTANDSAHEHSRRFHVRAIDGSARTGGLVLPNGTIDTPVFMPVGTQAAVKSLEPEEVKAAGAQIILTNTYHLMLRPGGELIESFGGVAQFMGWNGPVLTDSGGFQVYSLAGQRTLEKDGVRFRSHLDGSEHFLTPERAIAIQGQLGADITMALDVCAGYEASEEEHRHALDLTERWLPLNVQAFESFVDRTVKIRRLLFGICQGGFDVARRRRSAEMVNDSPVDGLAIGGLSVGEPKEILSEMLAASLEPLDDSRPRYLMGVGSPEDLWNAVAAGVDMFDCVLPTRVARHGGLYTPEGRVNIRAARFRGQSGPVDPTCDCRCCSGYSAAYVHHLFRAGELLAQRLATIHNLRFIARQMSAMRDAIEHGQFDRMRREFLDRYRPVDQAVRHDQRQRYLSGQGSGQ